MSSSVMHGAVAITSWFTSIRFSAKRPSGTMSGSAAFRASKLSWRILNGLSESAKPHVEPKK